MSSTRVLAISSSRVGNSAYLETASPIIKEFLGDKVINIAFIPFASVDNYGEYLLKVKEGLHNLPYNITVVLPDNATSVIRQSDAIMIGGGNTFKLLHDIYHFGLFNIIIDKVRAGTPYIGWSAGANIAGKTIGTTNDMPVIEPQSFKALGFFPFQINPHYINVKPEGHNGETRDQRLTEFTKLNPGVPVVCLPEGTALLLESESLTFTGQTSGVLFNSEVHTNITIRKEIPANTDLSYLLKL